MLFGYVTTNMLSKDKSDKITFSNDEGTHRISTKNALCFEIPSITIDSSVLFAISSEYLDRRTLPNRTHSRESAKSALHTYIEM